jgi:hypothetical protein
LHPDSHSRYDFHFDNERGNCQQLAIDFVNTEAHRFDQSQRAIKKLTFGWRERESAGSRGTWSTTDFSLASFVLSRGIRFVGFRRTHATKREYEFYFDGDVRQCDDLVISFVHSEAHRFDQSSRALKKLIFSR